MMPDPIQGGAAITFALGCVTLLKPLIEALPFVGETGAVHDSVLRILTFLLALASLAAMFKIEGGTWPYGTELLNELYAAALATGGTIGAYHFIKQSTPEAKAKKRAAKGIAKGGVATNAPAVPEADVSAPVPAS